jgi:molybdate transport system substrate-binding protein
MKTLSAFCLSAGLALAALAPAGAEELRLYAAAGVKAPVEQMAADFERSTGHKIALVFDTAGAAEQRFLADSGATFLVTTRLRVSAAEKSGKLKQGVTSVVGDTVGGFAGPPGHPKPDISTPAKLKAALLAAPRIAFSDPARGATVGAHFLQVIEALGIKDQVLKKSTLAKDGVETMQLVLDGKADLAVTQLSEIMQANRAALVGAFPPEFDLATTYALWLRNDASPGAVAFAKLITSPAERAKLAEHGLRAPQ